MNKGIISFIFVTFLVVGAVSALACVNESGLGATKWKLIEVKGQKMEDSSAGLEFSEDGKNFSGSAGCNRMFGGVTLEDSTIKFTAVGTTRMYCEGLMESENAILAALRTVDRYDIQAGELVLFTGDETVLRFSMDASNNDEVPEPQKFRLEDRKWMLDSIRGEKIGELEEAAFLVFDREKESAGGNTSCNLFGGSFETGEANSIRIFDTVSTMRACIEDNRMEIERGFMSALLEVNRFEINGNELILFKDQDALLSFTGMEKTFE
jgi:heat shock protein HslJ